MLRLKLYIGLLSILFFSCTYTKSNKTNWDYNNPRNGGFEKSYLTSQEKGPGLVLVPGGTFSMQLEQDSVLSNKTMTVVIPSFYMDEKEVSNINYREYLYWTNRIFNEDFPMVYENALPDTLVWLDKVGLANGFIKDYLRHPAYSDYPVVGVSWMQANNYCEWRTDRVNENILIREGILKNNPMQQSEPFTTGAYLAGQYTTGIIYSQQKIDYNPSNAGTTNGSSNIYGRRNITREDGLLLPNYRLPTEAEWEFAASGGINLDKKQQKKLDEDLGIYGQFLNKLYLDSTKYNVHQVVPVDAFIPNDYGIYNLNGNVSEWVADAYTERSSSNIKKWSPYFDENLDVPIPELQYTNTDKLQTVIYDLNKIKEAIDSLKTYVNADSIENRLNYNIFKELDPALEKSYLLYKDDLHIDASKIISDLYLVKLPELQQSIDNYNEDNDLASYPYPVLMTIKQVFVASVVDLPGNIQYRELHSLDRIKYRNNGSIYFESYHNEIAENNNRVYKGANWSDNSKWITPSYRRFANKYDSDCTIGFRCAMDINGTPRGLKDKK